MAATTTYGIQWIRIDAHGKFKSLTFPELKEDGDYSAINDASVLSRLGIPLKKQKLSNKEEFLESLRKCDVSCSTLHLNGHGVSGVGLLVQKKSEGGEGAAAPGNTSALIRELVEALKERSDVKFLFLNACQSADVAELIVKHTGVVCALGTEANLPDPGYEGMKKFVEILYVKLLNGLSVESSLKSACTATIEHIQMADVEFEGDTEVQEFLGDVSNKPGNTCKYRLVGDGAYSPWDTLTELKPAVEEKVNAGTDDGAAKKKPYYIYFITANPEGTLPTQALNVIQEIIDIVERDVRRKAPSREIKFKVGAHAARWKDVMVQLRSFQQETGQMPDIIHFVCHGMEEEDVSLAFQDGKVTEIMLGAMFENIELIAPGSVKAVVLTACNSDGFAECLVRDEDCKVPLAVGGVKSLSVRKARVWCSGFYLALCHGDSFGSAYKSGMTNVKMQLGEKPPEMVLMERQEGDKNTRIFPL